MITGKPRHSETQGNEEGTTQQIENMVTAWMADNQSRKWSEGVRFVQFMKNRAYHSEIKRTPYEAMFGCHAKVEPSSVIAKNILNPINTEEDLRKETGSVKYKDEDKMAENMKKLPRNIEIQDMKANHRKQNSKPPITRKPDVYLEAGKNLKKQRQILPKADGMPYVECEESLSKLQEISFTKYIHQNLNSKPHVRNELMESKWNGPGDDKLRTPENYVVKSWKHNSVEDLNSRHKQTKNNGIKKIRLEKPMNSRNEEPEQGEKNRTPSEFPTGSQADRPNLEEIEDKIKKEVDTEVMLVEPKQEIMEEEDTNSEDFSIHNTNNEMIIPDSDSLYESRSVPNYYQQPVVDRGVPVPLLMCRTSLSEPDSVDSNWMPPIGGNLPPDHPPQLNSVDGNAQDLQCRTCAQDLPCPTCTKKYKSRYALNRHILYECGKARKSFSCDECGKKVTRQDTLQKHKLIHLVQHLKKKESEGDEEPPRPKKTC